MSEPAITILLVEDNPADAELLIEMVKDDASDEVFSFEIASSVHAALHMLDQDDFDIILADLSLPDSSGLDTVAALRCKKSTTPIVVLTGLSDAKVGLAAVRKGAQDYLIKGEVSANLFSKAVHYAIERNRLEMLKDELLGNVSHELRTPLAIARESISQIADGLCANDSEKEGRYLKRALSNLDSLTSIINNLLDMAKLQDGQVELVKSETDFVELIKDIEANFIEKVSAQGLKLATDIPVEKLKILIDKEKIIQVFTNLISNALKFTKHGGIAISLKDEDDHVRCCVEDSGIGIADEELEKVFNKFEQVGRDHGAGAKGTGLGLSICKNIIDLHEGNIFAESVLGQGTKLIFTLPKLSAINSVKRLLEKTIVSAKKDNQDFSILWFYLKDADTLDEEQLDTIINQFKNLVNDCLYRKADTVINYANSVFVFLPEVTKVNAMIISNRIRETIDERMTSNLKLNDLGFDCISYPVDFVNYEEALTKLELGNLA